MEQQEVRTETTDMSEKEGVEKAARRLARLNLAAQKMPASMKDVLELVDDEMIAMLKAAGDAEVRDELFSQEALDAGNLMDGMTRLRLDDDGHWVQVFSGAEERAATEVYNYLQLVRIPKVALRILQGMGELPLREINKLSLEQKEDFYELEEMAFAALKKLRKVLRSSYDVDVDESRAAGNCVMSERKLDSPKKFDPCRSLAGVFFFGGGKIAPDFESRAIL